MGEKERTGWVYWVRRVRSRLEDVQLAVMFHSSRRPSNLEGRLMDIARLFEYENVKKQ